MKKNLLPLLGIAFAVAILATALFYGLFLSKMPSGAAAQSGRPVLVAARNLDRGAVLKPADVKVVAWGSPLEIKGAFTSAGEVAGLSLVQPLAENEPLTETRVASSKTGAGLGIPAGMRAVSVHIVDSSGVVAMLRPGHKVDVQVVGNPNPQHPEDVRIQTMLQHMEVLGANPQMESSTGRFSGQVLTLLATPSEADLLGLADSLARIRVTLRNPVDENKRRLPVLAQPALFQSRSPASPPAVIQATARGANPAAASREKASRFTFKVQMAGADPAALKELSAHLETSPQPEALEVLAFRRDFDLEGALRNLRTRRLVDLAPISSMTAGQMRQVSAYTSADSGASNCRVSLKLSTSPSGGGALRLRVEPEVAQCRTGTTRGIETELEVWENQSLLVMGLADAPDRPAMLRQFFPARAAEITGWQLLVVITPQLERPVEAAVLKRTN